MVQEMWACGDHYPGICGKVVVGDVLWQIDTATGRGPPVWNRAEVTKLTPCGFWCRLRLSMDSLSAFFSSGCGKPRWYSTGTHKWARTEAEAVEQYFFRKRARVRNLENRLEFERRNLAAAVVLRRSRDEMVARRSP